MRPAWKIGLLGACSALTAIAAFTGEPAPTNARVPVPQLVPLPPGAFQYRASGDFLRDGKPAKAPVVTAVMRPLAVMRHQVTAAEYWRCVAAGACPMIDRDPSAADRPMVKVSWRDAQAYASWLSRETGMPFRLPTDTEWAHAAGSRLKDDALPDDAYGDDPGRRALTIYDAAASSDIVDKEPQPIGSFGANENGLADMAGNVWEWTDTCFARVVLDGVGEAAATTVNCGVRVVAGRHRAYMPDFVRDARAGGCSPGTQPSNLGFRLVRDNDRYGLRAFIGKLSRPLRSMRSSLLTPA